MPEEPNGSTPDSAEPPPKVRFTIIELLVVIALVAIFVTCAMPNSWLVEAPITLAFGWITYPWKVLPKLNPDPWSVALAVACLVGVILGGHLFLRWLAGKESPWPLKRTLRCVGLVVLLFVAGIAVVGTVHQTSWLARAPEPLVRGGGRLLAARAQSGNNLKQIGVAVHSRYDDVKPPEVARSTFDTTGAPMHSWQTALLPYIEQDNLYKRIDRTKPWTDPANAAPLGERVREYLNPSINDEKVNGFGASHYAGNVAVVLGDAKAFDSFPAGTANTILAGEVSSNLRAWGDPLNARDPRFGATGHPQGFGGSNGRPAQFAMLDGSVRTLNSKELAELMSQPPR